MAKGESVHSNDEKGKLTGTRYNAKIEEQSFQSLLFPDIHQ